MQAVWSCADKKALRLARGFEPAHDFIAPSRVAVGGLASVVQCLVLAVCSGPGAISAFAAP